MVPVAGGFETPLAWQASIRACPALLPGVLVSLGRVKTIAAWFSPMQKLRKILDYFGINFTLATRTASNPIPIVKDHILILHFLARMYKNGTKAALAAGLISSA